ncbi:uncharacterized protein N7483_002356 [Penicillium malachiteum]|uniref:uncharacterized protein n=1 Tax=Penicillium malachiteum TaxID=1324776 RepID=UPI0025492A42|nr:uncharacterized protein N7483_002356 [Penicillium malachiteum]KAJ5737231.1 hypothetical protein N7483_002356 [Penicillium malachiteum]
MTNAAAIPPPSVASMKNTSQLVWTARSAIVWPGLETSGIPPEPSESQQTAATISLLSTGQLPMAPSLDYSPDIAPKAFAISGVAYRPPDYEILALISFISYMEQSNDTSFAREYWGGWKAAPNWFSEYRSDSTRLIDFSLFVNAFLCLTIGSVVKTASVDAFKGMASVVSSAKKWAIIAKSLQGTLNADLWSEEYGVYFIQKSQLGNFSLFALGFAITSGSANTTQINRTLSKLPSLKRGPEFRDSSLVAPSDSSANLSPNTNGVLLPALPQQKQAAPVAVLLDNVWGAMVSNDSTKSDTSSEYGGAATYALTNYVAGIRLVTFDYKSWVVDPDYAGFGLDEVSAMVPTPRGALSVTWAAKNSVVTVTIGAPEGTTRKMVLSKNWAFQGGINLTQ